MITGDIDHLAKKSKFNLKPVLSSNDNKKITSRRSTKNKNSQLETPTSSKRIKNATPQKTPRDQQNEKSVNNKNGSRQSIEKEKEPNTLKLPIRKPPTKGQKKQSKRELVSQGKKNAAKKKQMYQLLVLMLKNKIEDGMLISKLWAYNNIRFQFGVMSLHINRFIKRRQFKILKESYLRIKDTKKYLKRAAFKTYTEKSKSNIKKQDKVKDTSRFENDLIEYSDDPEILKEIEMEQKPVHPSKENKNQEPQRKKEKIINKKNSQRESLNLKESVNSKKLLKTSRRDLDVVPKQQQSKKSINKNRNSKDDVEKHLKELKKQPRKRKIKLPHKNAKNQKQEKDDDKDVVLLTQQKPKTTKNQKQPQKTDTKNQSKIEKVVQDYIKQKAKRKIFQKLFEIFVTSHTINEETEKMIVENRMRNILREWKYQTKKTFKTKIDLDFDQSQDEDLFSEQSTEDKNDPKIEMMKMFRKIVLCSKGLRALKVNCMK